MADHCLTLPTLDDAIVSITGDAQDSAVGLSEADDDSEESDDSDEESNDDDNASDHEESEEFKVAMKARERVNVHTCLRGTRRAMSF